jgi:hypothetical protein
LSAGSDYGLRPTTYDQSVLCRTRRWVPDKGFLTTIQNMIDVAKLRAYLCTVSCAREVRREEADVPSEDVLCVVVPQVDGWRPANGDALGFALVVGEQIRNCSLVRYPISIHCMHTATHS